MDLFSLRDSKGDVFHSPTCYRTVGEAIRAVQCLAENKDSMVGKFPDDFALFRIGSFDEKTGVCEPFKQPENIGGTVSGLLVVKK